MSVNMPDPATAPPWLGSPAAADSHEVAKWLAITSDANREWWFARAEYNSEQARNCYEHDHETRLAKLQQRLLAANERIDWLERHYVEGGRQKIRIHNVDPNVGHAADCKGCEP